MVVFSEACTTQNVSPESPTSVQPRRFSANAVFYEAPDAVVDLSPCAGAWRSTSFVRNSVNDGLDGLVYLVFLLRGHVSCRTTI